MSRLPKASDVVVTAIRDRILRQRLPVGHRLPSEVELAAELGVGRVAVREALRLLERDGLVEVRRGVTGGVFVRHPELGQVSDVISLLFATRSTTIAEWVEFRLLLEPTAAELAARHATAEQREVFAVHAAAAGVDLAYVPDLHLAVAEASGNSVLAVSLESLRRPFTEHFRPRLISEADLEATSAAHIRISERILAGDAPGARRAMTRHLTGYRDYMEQRGLMSAPLINLDQR
ncbi:FadR/GntR family transcriptional regulator [Enemella dayhoffiae]|nr:GntR family transcriptional regulator [Enemella dayhoffiae]